MEINTQKSITERFWGYIFDKLACNYNECCNYKAGYNYFGFIRWLTDFIDYQAKAKVNDLPNQMVWAVGVE